MDQNGEYQGVERRRVKRSRVILRAVVRADGADREVRLRNMSQAGAMLECDEPPPAGTRLVFKRGATSAPSEVIWADGHRFGIRFDQPIDEHELLEHIELPKSQPLAFEPPAGPYHPDISCRPLTPEEREICERWLDSKSAD